MTPQNRLFRIGSLALFSLLGPIAPLCAADLYDAPGREYFEQAAKVRLDPDRQLAAKAYQLRARAFAAQLRTGRQGTPRISAQSEASWLTSEVQRINQTLPQLPAENPFERPIHLIEVRGNWVSGTGR